LPGGALCFLPQDRPEQPVRHASRSESLDKAPASSRYWGFRDRVEVAELTACTRLSKNRKTRDAHTAARTAEPAGGSALKVCGRQLTGLGLLYLALCCFPVSAEAFAEEGIMTEAEFNRLLGIESRGPDLKFALDIDGPLGIHDLRMEAFGDRSGAQKHDLSLFTRPYIEGLQEFLCFFPFCQQTGWATPLIGGQGPSHKRPWPCRIHAGVLPEFVSKN
jgi:hypothetical protein